MTLRRMLRKAATASIVVAGAGVACTGALAVAAVANSRRKSERLYGKVALVTGASRGLGMAIAEELGRKGARLALAARDAAELERARALLIERGAVENAEDIAILPCDLRNPQSAEWLIQQVTSLFGRIDILVNNAGVIQVGPIENQTVQDFRDVMDANFFSGLHCTVAILPQMLERGRGNIVNITSIGGKIAIPHLLPYTTSKFAAVGLSEGLNAELRSKGIRVTTVCPGLMRTGSHLNALFNGNAAKEYRWFSFAAGVPGLSASARTAARKIVRAMIVGKAEIAITPQAILATRIADLCPTATARTMQMLNAALPSAVPENGSSLRGADARSQEIKPAVFLTRAAARRYNEI